jgi:hypothetical protein
MSELPRANLLVHLPALVRGRRIRSIDGGVYMYCGRYAAEISGPFVTCLACLARMP